MAAIGVIGRAGRQVYQDRQILRCTKVPYVAVPTAVRGIALAVLSGDCRAAQLGEGAVVTNGIGAAGLHAIGVGDGAVVAGADQSATSAV